MSDQQELMAQFEMIQQALGSIDGQLARIEQQATDLRRAKATLDGLVLADGKQTLVPIGGGLHLRASIDPSAPVLNPIGRGYAADLDIEAAKEALQSRIEEAETLMQEKSQEADRLASQARSLANQIQASD